MSVKRYDSRNIGINRHELYKDFFKAKNIKHIRQYFSPELRHPTYDEIKTLNKIGHIWKLGDRFYKLANQYYGDSELWWVIAWFNWTPTENHVKLGNLIYIPLPLDKTLLYMGI